MGPGPSNVHPSVLAAQGLPLLGHLDPEFLHIMDQVQQMLRKVFGTQNRLTIPISGTGSAGMEAALVNIIEPQDRVLVLTNGVFGARMEDIVQRIGADLKALRFPWGKPIEPKQVKNELESFSPAVTALVHAETSTGVLQPLGELSKIIKDTNTLLVVDAVTSLGGAELSVDQLGIDVCYSGTQKCLSCPPGLAPITFSEKALEKMNKRKTKVQSWYLDMSMIQRYWGEERAYHHTAPVSAILGLQQGLRLVLEEGLEARWRRHIDCHRLLVEKLQALGLELLVEKQYRAPMLNSVLIPPGVDDKSVRTRLLIDYGIEIGAGLGELAGKIWRIGLMGESCTKNNVLLLCSALKEILER